MSEQRETVVRFDNVHKSYGRIPVLKGISFEVGRCPCVIRKQCSPTL